MPAPEPQEETKPARFRARDGAEYALPLFLPVYQPRSPVFEFGPQVEGIIVNAYFLYKQRELRRTLVAGTLKSFIGFDGLVATDSGAFQALSRKLYLSNRDIVAFQDAIGSDVIAPLDLITPPGDKRTVAEEKLRVTEKRVEEGLRLVQRGMLAGVQQGGRFLDLRQRSVRRLVELGVPYIAIGSLVPFFNVNHDLSFPAAVLIDARREAGPAIPIHVYGAGDPVELPFMMACGATIFDSASYGHYAEGGWYMTPFGALTDPGPVLAGEFACACPSCSETAIAEVFADKVRLARHNLWTICDTVARLRQIVPFRDRLEAYLANVLGIHQAWFPESALAASWRASQEALG